MSHWTIKQLGEILLEFIESLMDSQLYQKGTDLMNVYNH